jgi:hypothetical protein
MTWQVKAGIVEEEAAIARQWHGKTHFHGND